VIYIRQDGSEIELNDAPANVAKAAELGWKPKVSSGDAEDAQGEEISQPGTEEAKPEVSKPNTRKGRK